MREAARSARDADRRLAGEPTVDSGTSMTQMLMRCRMARVHEVSCTPSYMKQCSLVLCVQYMNDRDISTVGPVIEKTCAATQKNVKSHIFLAFEKNVKKT